MLKLLLVYGLLSQDRVIVQGPVTKLPPPVVVERPPQLYERSISVDVPANGVPAGEWGWSIEPEPKWVIWSDKRDANGVTIAVPAGTYTISRRISNKGIDKFSRVSGVVFGSGKPDPDTKPDPKPDPVAGTKFDFIIVRGIGSIDPKLAETIDSPEWIKLRQIKGVELWMPPLSGVSGKLKDEATKFGVPCLVVTAAGKPDTIVKGPVKVPTGDALTALINELKLTPSNN